MKKENFQSFIIDLEVGHIQLNISRTFTLDEIAKAHRSIESNAGIGKIVVVTYLYFVGSLNHSTRISLWSKFRSKKGIITDGGNSSIKFASKRP